MMFNKQEPEKSKNNVPNPSDSPKPTNQIEEKIPEDIIEDIKKLNDKKNSLFSEFVHISINSTKIEMRKQELIKKIGEMDEQVGNKLQFAYKKMKLQKREDIAWRFNGVDGFIGIPQPKKQSKPIPPLKEDMSKEKQGTITDTKTDQPSQEK